MVISLPDYSVASCFYAYVAPHLLFKDEYFWRRQTASLCRLAWNIGTCADAWEQEQRINAAWNLLVSQGHHAPQAELETDFKREICERVIQKRELFPNVLTGIKQVELLQGSHQDVLYVVTDSGNQEEVAFDTHPNDKGLPHVIGILSKIQSHTAAQMAMLVAIGRDIPDEFDDITLTKMDRAYAVQRANLIAYSRILTQWRESLSGQWEKDSIDRWLDALLEIERYTNTVLNLICEALRSTGQAMNVDTLH